jgi:hypothetical protein
MTIPGRESFCGGICLFPPKLSESLSDCHYVGRRGMHLCLAKPPKGSAVSYGDHPYTVP